MNQQIFQLYFTILYNKSILHDFIIEYIDNRKIKNLSIYYMPKMKNLLIKFII